MDTHVFENVLRTNIGISTTIKVANMPRDTNTKRWAKEVRTFPVNSNVNVLMACGMLLTFRGSQEDIALRDIVEIWHNEGDNDGRAKWPAIAELLKQRTGIGRAPKQCRER